MQYELTPAAERALVAASCWTGCPGCCPGWRGIGAPALLLGLLAEPECRAAEMLAHAGIGAGKVRQQWPDLKQKEPTQPATPPPRTTARRICFA